MTTATENSILDALRAKEGELQTAVDEARARIALYPDQLHEARQRSWYSNPKARSGSDLTGDVAKITAKEKKDLTALNGLEGDLSSIRSVLAIEAQRVTEEATAEAGKQLEQLHKQEESVYQRAGVLFSSLANVWNDLVEVIESEDQFVQANKLDGGALAVEPTPASFKAFLLLLHSAATDADVRSAPHTEELVDSGIYGRRDANGADIGGATYDTRVVGTRTIETRRRLDSRDRLFSIVPDLRSVVRALSLSGRVPKFTAE